ncbi:MAG: hypothetical protein KAU17_14870 [Spirochaetales bacterium]|nr:hypothetical protein [Spirochaetales bacterium]
MPSIERKSLDRISRGDRLLIDAGGFAKAGKPLNDRMIQLLARYRVTWVPVLSLSYEEKQPHLRDIEADPAYEDRLIADSLRNLREPFSSVRFRMLDKLRSIYSPFSEEAKSFQVRGKKKHITRDILLERNPGPLYQPDIDAGSEAIISQAHVSYLKEALTHIYSQLEQMTVRDPETKGKKNRIPLQNYHSIRLQNFYDIHRLSSLGDAVPWHVLDTACYFLATIVNLNKKRIIKGIPVSETRFDPTKSSDLNQEYQYHQEMIIDATLGILLHSIGLSHDSVARTISAKPVYDCGTPACRKQRKTVQRSHFVTKNLLRNRHDLSAITRMMVSLERDYPDTTGYPPPFENRFLHEFVRLFHIIDFYDEMTNPIIHKHPYCRMQVIDYMQSLSGPYEYSTTKIQNLLRFDEKLLEEFLSLLAPYDIGEKVSLGPEENPSECYFVGQVFSCSDSWFPIISILKDERLNRKYNYGSLLFHIPASTALYVEKGKITKRVRLPWMQKLKIRDQGIGPGDIRSFRDPVFGGQRPLSKLLKVLLR